VLNTEAQKNRRSAFEDEGDIRVGEASEYLECVDTPLQLDRIDRCQFRRLSGDPFLVKTFFGNGLHITITTPASRQKAEIACSAIHVWRIFDNFSKRGF
jgi:hypothetical protein